MICLNTLLENNYAVLFIAPPGWGKTRMLIKMIASSNRSWIFISPLRALANEFYLATVEQIAQTFLVQSNQEFQELKVKNIDYRLLIVTPEVFKCSKINKDSIFIWDEFHLNYYWGDSFRFSLEELYYEVASAQRPLLKLTATMSRENLRRWKREMQLNYHHHLCINIANQCLKNNAENYYFYPQWFKKYLWKNLELDLFLNQTGTTLLFCRYRQEVDRVVNEFQNKGHQVLACKGGETKDFATQLARYSDPKRLKLDLIVATTAISHGVNLPAIHRIYFSYAVRNRDFWIQMVGRGGRKGENFQVHTMDFEPECGKKWQAVGKSLHYLIQMQMRRFLCLLRAWL